MKPSFTILVVSLLLGAAMRSLGQTPCEVFVRASVEVNRPDVSLADLLEPGACPAILEAARAVRLGAAPKTGSVRVSESGQVRAVLEDVAHRLGGRAADFAFHVPDRVSVRQGSQLSCGEIIERVVPNSAHGPECEALGGIPREASLEVARKRWDPATKSWGIVVRCGRPQDCVPFLVRLPDANLIPPGLAMRSRPHSPALSGANDLVRAGEAVRLTWDQNGIRAVLDAVCLDRGRQGDVVRARVTRTGLTLRAVVVARKQLRTQS